MNEFQKGKTLNSEKPFPGCMGRMVNLFDLGAGMAGNRLLTEKAHRDGSPHSRARLESTKVFDSIGDHVEDKLVACEFKRSPSNKKSNGTPMKMLIAQEMSKEPGSKRKPPSVVARLMGLDALPAQQPMFIAEGCPPEGYLAIDSPVPVQILKHQQEQNGFQEKQMHHKIRPSQTYDQGSPEYKDVYEVWHQSSRSSHTKDQFRYKGRCNEDTNEKKMALVRQKFFEAKRLATDEKLRQSKEFQDALEVLSSNRDLFLKFLQEPNSLLSKNLYELQSIPPPETKRITVLKPSKSVEAKIGKPKKKQHQGPEADKFNGTKPFWSTTNGHPRVDHSSTQPTRIVVLKPSPGKAHDIKVVTSSPTSSPRLLHCRDIQEFEIDGAKGSREIAKEITRQMQENLSSNRRDDLLLSSALSNGYVGDASSFNKSECEYVEEENLIDSESLTPTSRHSWDYVNRYSAFSSSSFSRASYSPESTVSREAKKRLSERWAMMASNGSGQEPRQVSRSSSTLGEMLALPETKKIITSGERDEVGMPNIPCSRSCGGEQELGLPSSCLSSNGSKDEHVEGSPRNLLRSKSVPVSATTYEKVKLNIETSDLSSKSIISKEVPKPKSGKSSLKVKVSSLFFSRNKKPNKEKPCPSTSAGSQGRPQSKNLIIPGSSEMAESQVETRNADIAGCVAGLALEKGQSIDPTSFQVESKHGFPSSKGIVPLAKSEAPEHSSENQDQPSPISILDAPFEDDVTSPQSSRKIALEPSHHHRLLKTSDATARSPLIESVTRSLIWDEDTLEAPILSKLESSSLSLPKAEEKEQEWFLFVHMLLSAAGLDQERSDIVSRKWYSTERPLDPLLLDKCASWGDEEHVSQAKCRQQRSERKLLFDCVNAALMEMVASVTDARPWVVTPRKRLLPGVPVCEGVWAHVKEWSSDEGKNCYGETDHSLIVERVVRHEVERREWVEHMRMELDEIGDKLEKEVLAELVDEAVAELSSN
ncbi:uncharacterized protein [Aristolochia californica]|uniref:uncharacterized protein n=1 Tax=Aristolochia californica TaxID=171875 RepID=UPI0035DBC860